MGTTTDDEQVIREVMDRWKAAVDAHEPAQVAACFTEDAIFQGMRPYSVGRPGGDDAVLRVPADGHALGVHLGVLATRTAGGWQLAHCQVSYLP
ncbi:MAG TPA: nuclear transport factor 2 family protein [Trebonia sp.]|nr:nuclear transport factor 2 family protein [Trebonia sp.]